MKVINVNTKRDIYTGVCVCVHKLFMGRKQEKKMSDLTKTRELIVKKFEQTVKERAKCIAGEEECETFNASSSTSRHDSQPFDDVAATSSMTSQNDYENNSNDNNIESNSFSVRDDDDDDETRLPANPKRYIIRSANQKGIKITPSLFKPTSSAVQSNKRKSMLKSLDANGLCNRLRVLKSIQEEGISTFQHQEEVDFILNKLRKMQIIL